jgi:hypothetical protein
VGNVLDIESPAAGGLVVYAFRAHNMWIGPLCILLVHAAYPEGGHYLDLRDFFDKYVNFFLDFSVSLGHVVPVVVEDGEDVFTELLDNGQGSVDLSK